jgi:hypothetical protein
MRVAGCAVSDGADRRPNRLATPVAVAALVMLLPLTDSVAPNRTNREAGTRRIDPPRVSWVTADYRYRVVGKVRLLFFWTGTKDVGRARITSLNVEHSTVVALVVGTDPQRAPRGLNEWGYIREQVEGETASVFGVRTLTNPDSLEEAQAGGVGPQVFGALCSSVTPTMDRSVTTSVRAGRDLTYRNPSALLDLLELQVRWQPRSVRRPPGSAPGFLTALQRLLQWSVARVESAGPAARGAAAPVSYVYKGIVYDLELQQARLIGGVRIGLREFQDVIRGAFQIRNRSTGERTGFELSYGSRGTLAAVPIQATYEPHWWIRVQLELDDQADAPPDPAADPDRLRRIQAICQSRLTH